MCDDVERTSKELQAAGAKVDREISDQGWGRLTSLHIPGDVDEA